MEKDKVFENMSQYRIYLPIVSNQQPTLKELFGNYGIRFGFSVGSASFKNKITRGLIVQHANICTTEVALKMYLTQPYPDKWDWSEGDRIVEESFDLGIPVHGHTASWHMQNPNWLVTGSFTNEQLAIILKTHVSKLSNHYNGKLISLDTANEAYIKPDGGVYGGPWQPLDEDYVRLSFESATIDCPVMYNSFYPHEPEYDKALNLLDKGWADGIGIQLHLWDGSYQEKLANIETFLKQIRQRGSWCRFSEVSVLAANEQSQAKTYGAVTRLAVKYHDIVKGVIIWGILPPMWRGDVGIFNKQGQPKPSYYAIIKELNK